MMQKHNIPEEVINAFHMMWDTYPIHARLIHKDRTVLAVNKAGEKMGMTVGVRCFEQSPSRDHSRCLANQALEENTAKYQVAVVVPRMAFWIPVAGVPDVYVHSYLPLPTEEDKATSH